MVADRQETNARQLVSPDRPERDKAAKAMLQDKQIFSLVLRLMCPEYADFTVRELSSRIREVFRMPLSAANELAVLNEKMETMDPALTVAVEGTTVNDQVCVIQDMETEKLYVVIIAVNNTMPTAEVMANRNDCCIARDMSGQQNRIKGMNTDCAGLNDLKMFWIYPTAIFSDDLIITWEVKARQCQSDQGVFPYHRDPCGEQICIYRPGVGRFGGQNTERPGSHFPGQKPEGGPGVHGKRRCGTDGSIQVFGTRLEEKDRELEDRDRRIREPEAELARHKAD
ncbi:hypothetical protein [Faecalibaculum rodentium]|uniref:hypothetical protein n=1 Tax=Faecalibaculum rodentium TaxID=1702221 RepID=UPI00256E9C32|nr:hypothetical protein [Faecalibaculum rodentium]